MLYQKCFYPKKLKNFKGSVMGIDPRSTTHQPGACTSYNAASLNDIEMI